MYVFPDADQLSRSNYMSIKTILTQDLIEYGKHAKLSIGKGADAKKRNAASSYVIQDGELAGVGHTVSLHSIVKCEILTLIRKTTLLFQLPFSSPAHSSITRQPLWTIFTCYPCESINSLSALILASLSLCKNSSRKRRLPTPISEPCLKSILFLWKGVRFSSTRRRQIMPIAWILQRDGQSLWCLGTGTLFFPRLNLRVRYVSGVGVALRGRLLKHKVEVGRETSVFQLRTLLILVCGISMVLSVRSVRHSF